jgi:uncharacterized coiled-coil DUF342 family protein
MNAPTDLDIRVAALAQEYQAHIQQLSGRAATLAAELASTQAKLKDAEVKIEALTEKKHKKAEAKIESESDLI